MKNDMAFDEKAEGEKRVHHVESYVAGEASQIPIQNIDIVRLPCTSEGALDCWLTASSSKGGPVRTQQTSNMGQRSHSIVLLLSIDLSVFYHERKPSHPPIMKFLFHSSKLSVILS